LCHSNRASRLINCVLDRRVLMSVCLSLGSCRGLTKLFATGLSSHMAGFSLGKLKAVYPLTWTHWSSAEILQLSSSRKVRLSIKRPRSLLPIPAWHQFCGLFVTRIHETIITRTNNCSSGRAESKGIRRTKFSPVYTDYHQA
jgi:hypothetical protein